MDIPRAEKEANIEPKNEFAITIEMVDKMILARCIPLEDKIRYLEAQLRRATSVINDIVDGSARSLARRCKEAIGFSTHALVINSDEIMLK